MNVSVRPIATNVYYLYLLHDGGSVGSIKPLSLSIVLVPPRIFYSSHTVLPSSDTAKNGGRSIRARWGIASSVSGLSDTKALGLWRVIYSFASSCWLARISRGCIVRFSCWYHIDKCKIYRGVFWGDCKVMCSIFKLHAVLTRW